SMCVLSVYSPHTDVFHSLSLHDALPISRELGHRLGDVEELHDTAGGRGVEHHGVVHRAPVGVAPVDALLDLAGEQHVTQPGGERSEEHTSELQSRENLVCRLLLEKKNNG